MALAMIKHTLTASWVKIATAAQSITLQGMPGGYIVHFGSAQPDDDSAFITSPRTDGNLSFSDMGGVDVWIKASPGGTGAVGNVVMGAWI